MNVFAISDLHLSESVEKPMDIFGGEWEGHFGKIKEDWEERVTDGDLVLIGGDTSWGLKLEEAKADFDLIQRLPGKKIVIRGNHDYWWSSLKKITDAFPHFTFLQNNSVKIGNFVIAGTRGWTIANDKSSDEDKKIFSRELQRLRLSLDDAVKKAVEGDIIIALMHFPPFDADLKETEVTKILEEYRVNIATYGHLHGKNARVMPKVVKNNISYYLTSCDLIGNRLVKLV